MEAEPTHVGSLTDLFRALKAYAMMGMRHTVSHPHDARGPLGSPRSLAALPAKERTIPRAQVGGQA